jgi:hypothetical protein
MARTRLELLAEGSVATIILAAFLLTAFPLAVKGEARDHMHDSNDDSSAQRR